MIPAIVMAKLATLGLSAGQAEAVAEMLATVEHATKQESDTAIEARRANDRERKERQRHGKSRDFTGRDVTSEDKVSPKKETSPEPPKEKTTPSNAPSESAREFAEFWSLFPNKVGKRDAEREFYLALKRASFEAIMAGLRRYVAKTDDRPWCNPSTFLHQDRWADQPAQTPPRPHSTASPPAPRNAGELARMRLNGTLEHEPGTRSDDRRLDAGNGERQAEGTGIARRFAVSSDILGRA